MFSVLKVNFLDLNWKFGLSRRVFLFGAMANGRRMEYNYENAHNVGVGRGK